MSAIFGTDTKAKLFIPGGSASWSIGDIVKARQYDNALLLSFSLVDQETIDIRRCFEETTHIFAYGRNMNTSLLQVSLLLFLYDGCKGAAANRGGWLKTSELRDKYEQNRIYKKQDTIKIVIDDFNIDGYLIKMDISDVNPALKTCTATFTFIPDQEV